MLRISKTLALPWVAQGVEWGRVVYLSQCQWFDALLLQSACQSQGQNTEPQIAINVEKHCSAPCICVLMSEYDLWCKVFWVVIETIEKGTKSMPSIYFKLYGARQILTAAVLPQEDEEAPGVVISPPGILQILWESIMTCNMAWFGGISDITLKPLKRIVKISSKISRREQEPLSIIHKEWRRKKAPQTDIYDHQSCCWGVARGEQTASFPDYTSAG